MRLVAPFAVSVFVLSSCSEPAESSASKRTLSAKYSEMSLSIQKTAAALKSSATTADTVVPADLGSVAHLPASVTGGIDIAEELSGKHGVKAANVDGTGEEESVTIFVPDPPTGGTSTSVTSPSFLAWKGSDGLCHLAWSRGPSWFVMSSCGDTTGAWVCSATSEGATCEACDAAGECAPCDVEQPDFTCAW